MKILGHSVHPILIVFPLGLLAAAVVFDLIFIVTGNATFTAVAFWMIVSGIVGGLMAAPFGWIDWFKIPPDTRAKSVGLAHGLVNTAVLVLFAASLYVRYTTPSGPTTLAYILSFAGAAVALVGGWLGGELVERLGVSVHRGANVNAPSSLKESTVSQG